MSSRLHAVTFDALDPQGLATFWSAVLQTAEPVEAPPGSWSLPPGDVLGFRLAFHPGDVSKEGPNRIHFDLTSTSPQDQQATVERALAHGGSHLDVGQLPEEEHVVLADPEGNAFCVIPSTNRFLADTARIGALSCDGSRAVGLFWSAALEWPLVWDEGDETAIQSPEGGSKISWGGGPDYPESGRIHVDLVSDGDVQAEAERLAGLGARIVETTPQGARILRDPDDNPFCLLAPPTVE